MCKPGWEGSACESSGCVNDCMGHGVCNRTQGAVKAPKEGDATNGTVPGVGVPETTNPGPGRYRCVCDPGFEGDDCGTAVCVNRCTDLKHGVCRNGTCVCASGFDGVDCSIPAGNNSATGEKHECVVECNTKCNLKCGKELLKGVAFKTKCLQKCMVPCKDDCKNPISDVTKPGKKPATGFALKNTTASQQPDLLHAQRDGGGPQPNEMRPQPTDDPVIDNSRVAPQRDANGGGPRDGLHSAAAKEANAAKQE